MSANLTQNTAKTRPARKAGRTLVTIIKEGFDESVFKDLEGLVANHKTTSGAVFLRFDTEVNSVNAFNSLKSEHGAFVNVKYAHYKVFFKLDGLTNEDDYDQIKKLHINWIEQNVQGKVLYYRLYKKDGEYLNCGDLTIDTKESLDMLLSENKEYELNNTMKGTYYRFKTNKNRNDQTV